MPTDDAPVSNDLARYLAIPLRRWRVVLAVVLVAILAVGAYLAAGPRSYSATSSIGLNAIVTNPFDATKVGSQAIDTATEAKTATSPVVAQVASDKLSGHPDPDSLEQSVTIAPVTGTTTLSFTFTGSSPGDAAAGANAFAQAYLYMRAKWAGQQRDSQVAALTNTEKTLNAQLTKVSAQLAGSDPTTAAYQEATTQRNVLTQQVTDITTQINTLTGMNIYPGQQISTAAASSAVASPSRAVLVLGGLVVGLVLGSMAAFAREAADPKLRRVGQFAEVGVHGAVTTGAISRDASPDDALYVLRGRVLKAKADHGTSVLMVVDWSRPPSAGAVATWLSRLVAETGTHVQMLTIGAELGPGESERRQGAGGAAWSQIERHWIGGPVESVPQPRLRAVIEEGRKAGALTVLATMSSPRRSVVVEFSSLADGVILVAETGYSQLADLRGSVRDVYDSGSQTIAGVLIKGRRLRRQKKDVQKHANLGAFGDEGPSVLPTRAPVERRPPERVATSAGSGSGSGSGWTPREQGERPQGGAAGATVLPVPAAAPAQPAKNGVGPNGRPGEKGAVNGGAKGAAKPAVHGSPGVSPRGE